MAYSQQTWQNGLGGGTALSAARLNHMEDGINGADDIATQAAQDAATLAATVASMQAAVQQLQSNFLTTGEETFPRLMAQSGSVTLNGGTIRFSFFTCKVTRTTTQVRTSSGNSASGTPTAVLNGLYSVDANTGDLTRIALTTHDAALYSVINTQYTKNWNSSASMTRGLRYAFGALYTGSSAPNLMGIIMGGANAEAGMAPRLSAGLTGQTGMPSFITAASLTAAGQCPYAVML